MLWDSFFLHKSSNPDMLLCVLNTGGVGKEKIATQGFKTSCRKVTAVQYFILRMWI